MLWRQIVVVLLVNCLWPVVCCSQSHDVGSWPYPFQVNHVDEKGRPNFTRVIFDESYFSPNMSQSENLRMREFKAHIVESRKFTYQLDEISGDYTYPDMRMLESTDRLHPKLAREIDAKFGEEFTQRARKHCYQNFLTENSLVDLIALPHVAESIGLSKANLDKFKSDSVKLSERLDRQIRKLLQQGFDEIFESLSSRQRDLVLKQLGVDVKHWERLPDWVLRAIIKGTKSHPRSLLLRRSYDVDQPEFDFAILLEKKRVVGWLELIDEQKESCESFRLSWLKNRESVDVSRRNRELKDLLLDEQFEQLQIFAMREIFFRGDVGHFFKNAYVQSRLKLERSKKMEFLRRVAEISSQVTSERHKLMIAFEKECRSLLDEAAVANLNKLLN